MGRALPACPSCRQLRTFLACGSSLCLHLHEDFSSLRVPYRIPWSSDSGPTSIQNDLLCMACTSLCPQRLFFTNKVASRACLALLGAIVHPTQGALWGHYRPIVNRGCHGLTAGDRQGCSLLEAGRGTNPGSQQLEAQEQVRPDQQLKDGAGRGEAMAV